MSTSHIMYPMFGSVGYWLGCTNSRIQDSQSALPLSFNILCNIYLYFSLALQPQ